MRLTSLAASASLLLAGCTASAHTYDVTQAQWDAGLARLARMRATFPSAPYTRAVTISFFEPRTRRRFEGRGAIGVDPGHAMRMILVGPAGTPAFDVWVTRSAWWMEVPAISFRREGGAESPPGLPIGFFRSWFIDPLGGRPLALGWDGELVVRDVAGGTLSIAEAPNGASIRRRAGKKTEQFAYDETSAGGHATYRDDATGLELTIALEPIQADPPSPSAFVKPRTQAGGPTP